MNQQGKTLVKDGMRINSHESSFIPALKRQGFQTSRPSLVRIQRGIPGVWGIDFFEGNNRTMSRHLFIAKDVAPKVLPVDDLCEYSIVE